MKTVNGLEVKLPVLDLLKEAANVLWHKRDEVARIFLPAVFILAILDFISGQMQESGEISLQLGQLIIVIPSLLLSILLATTCHNYTLKPEVKVVVFKWLSNAEWRYLLRGMQIGIIAAVFFSVIFFTGISVTQNPAGIMLVSVASIMPAIYIWGRLSIILPEVAIGRDSSLKRAWSLSKDNGWRVTLVVIGIPVILMLPFMGLYILENSALNLVASIGIYLGTLISLVTLSLSYRFLADFHDGSDHTPALEQNFNA